MDFNRLKDMPLAIRGALPIGAKKTMTDHILDRAKGTATTVAPEQPERKKRESRKETEKKVKKISDDSLEAFIDSEPSKKDVYEYFKAKIEALDN
jgi:GTP1/Obg family GTP-binding protein